MIVLPEAETDIDDAVVWYEARGQGLGDRFLRAIHGAFGRIEAMPELFRTVYGPVRRAPVARFPYHVFYRIEGGEVVIVAVVHPNRDPKSWQSRI